MKDVTSELGRTSHRDRGRCPRPVEGVNGIIKDDGSFNRASCRALGLAGHAVAALMPPSSTTSTRTSSTVAWRAWQDEQIQEKWWARSPALCARAAM